MSPANPMNAIKDNKHRLDDNGDSQMQGSVPGLDSSTKSRSRSSQRKRQQRRSRRTTGRSRSKSAGRNRERKRRPESTESKSCKNSMKQEIPPQGRPKNSSSRKALSNSETAKRRESTAQKRSVTPQSRHRRQSRSRAFRKSPPPIEWHERGGDKTIERPGSRRSLAKKSESLGNLPTARELHQEQEAGRLDSLVGKSISFGTLCTKQEPNELGRLNQQPMPIEERQVERHRLRRSLEKISASFLGTHNLRPRSSITKKLSSRNIFGNKNQQYQDIEVDWKGLGLKECSYYQAKSNTSSGSMQRMKSLSSFSMLPRNLRNRGQVGQEEKMQNAVWDNNPEGEALKDTPLSLKNCSAFRRITQEEKEERSKINKEKRYADVSVPKKLKSFDKKHKDGHSLTTPDLEQVLQKRYERRQSRSSLTEKLVGNFLGGQYREISGSRMLDITDRDSTGYVSSNEDEDEDIGVRLLVFRE